MFHILGIIQKLKGDLITVLKAEKDELESSLSKEKLHTIQLKQELADAEARNSDLSKVITLIVKSSVFILETVEAGYYSSVHVE